MFKMVVHSFGSSIVRSTFSIWNIFPLLSELINSSSPSYTPDFRVLNLMSSSFFKKPYILSRSTLLSTSALFDFILISMFLKCTYKLNFLEKCLSQCGHRKLATPIWIISMCFSRLPF
jgi:hypothetical protein